MMILLGLTLLNLATTPALAEPAARCGQAEQRCAVKTEPAKKTQPSKPGAPVQKAEPTKKHIPSDAKEQTRKDPKVGEVMSGGRALQTAEVRKLARPATGRAYRVMEDRVVLVDVETMKIVQVLGLASEILRKREADAVQGV
ncbi:hypothetical protein [Paracoccus yeei]|jgi:hypothetical protein|uniref:hypothetical protein n=1 Tax=Paracoccus yeei TaxID=147645 RepID=UPI003BF80CE4